MRRSIVTLAALLMAAASANANGVFEDRSWQFMSPSERSIKLYVLELAKKHEAGFFDAGAFSPLNKHFNLGCSSDADTSGNDILNDVAPTIASPVGLEDNEILATTIGNENLDQSHKSYNQVDQDNTDSSLDANADNNDILNHGDQTSTATDNDQTVTNDQDITDSTLDATTTGNRLCNVIIHE